MIKKIPFIYLFFWLLFSSFGFCQTKSSFPNVDITSTIPKIIPFSQNDFNADPQFLTMCENDDGTLIFGNNDGVLIFDGQHWQKIRLPNNSPANSILKTDKGKIYVGGYNELGSLQKNKFGAYFYKSLNSKYLPQDKNLENIWQIHEFNKHIIFRSLTELIITTGGRLTHLQANNAFIYSDKVGDDYFVQDKDFGIYKFDKKTMTLLFVFDTKSILNENIVSLLPTSNPNIIMLISELGTIYFGDIVAKSITKKSSLFEGVKKDHVTSAIQSSKHDFLIGTRNSKIIKLSGNGEIVKENETFSRLSNATIHNLFQTKNKNVWVLQNNGLCLLDYKSPFVKIFDKSSVYDILVKNNVAYIATSGGVYYSDFSNNSFNFKEIVNTQGQAWAVQEEDGDIIVSHDMGLFKLENGNAQKIDFQNGFWKITKVKDKKGLYLGSSYNGLYLIEKNGNNWSIKHRIGGFDESTRDIIADYEPNTYWVCHGYKGVYKIHINADYSRIDAVEHFTDKNGFKSPFNINVFNWNKKTVFTTNTGIFTYNNDTNKFELFTPLNTILDPSKNTRKLIESNKTTWFIQDDEVGYFIGNKHKLYKDLFLNLKGVFNRGMESIYPLNDNRVLLGTNNGLYLYSLSENKAILPTIISKIIYTKNQKQLLVEINSNESDIEIPNETDLLHFEFTSPKMISSATVYYSYKLENLDQNWSSWQTMAYKEYTHLNPGNYTFVVKSRNLAGFYGKECRFRFTVLPKWYQTYLFYFLLLITITSILFYTIKQVKRKINLDQLKLKLEFEKSKQLIELELEKLKIKQEKEDIHKDKLILEEDILEKNKELANYTLLLSQKKDLFDDLKMDLKKLRDVLKNDESRKKVTEIFQKVNYYGIGEEYIEIFDVNFEKINHSFYEKLLKIDSKLTKSELRLCSFVKMNLSNKEIAPLLNISIRGVENARYKIRKKLNVGQELNFTTFLNDLHQNDEM